MDTDLNIYPVKDEGEEKKTKRELHPNLPNVFKAQAILLVAPLRGGKGVLIQNLLHRFYKDLFANVDIISPTAAGATRVSRRRRLPVKYVRWSGNVKKWKNRQFNLNFTRTLWKKSLRCQVPIAPQRVQLSDYNNLVH